MGSGLCRGILLRQILLGRSFNREENSSEVNSTERRALQRNSNGVNSLEKRVLQRWTWTSVFWW